MGKKKNKNNKPAKKKNNKKNQNRGIPNVKTTIGKENGSKMDCDKGSVEGGWQQQKRKGKKGKKVVMFTRPKGPGGSNNNNHPVRECKADMMKRMVSHQQAHKQPIKDIICIGEEIYTIGQDNFLKTWKPKEDPMTKEVKFETVRSLDLESGCWSMYFADDTMFIGLQDGKVKAFHKSGGSGVLDQHTKRVSSITVMGGVVITGSHDKSIRFWQVENGAFVSRNVIELNAEVNKIHLAETGPGKNEKVLWVGTQKGLFAINIQDLSQPPMRLAQDIDEPVTALKENGEFMLVGFKSGLLKLYGKDGSEKHTVAAFPDSRNLHAMEVIEAGPRLLCGFHAGTISSFALPTFERRAQWQAFNSGVTCIKALNRTCYVVGSATGDLQLWKHEEAISCTVNDDDI